MGKEAGRTMRLSGAKSHCPTSASSYFRVWGLVFGVEVYLASGGLGLRGYGKV